jgi:formiminoglutamase
MTYSKSQKVIGRIDGDSKDLARFHQVIKYIDLANEKITLAKGQKGFVFLGSAIDEGVKRNQGRVGAAKAPQAIRQAMASFPVHFDEEIILFDGGNIEIENGDLEKAQVKIGSYIAKILAANCTPILLGGGHDITYSNHLGVKDFAGNKKVGIINVDAHFDLRPIDPTIGGSSGASIYKIASEARKNGEHFSCLALGIQKYGNTKLLFNLAKEFGVDYALGDDFSYSNKENLLQKVSEFIAKNELIYLTICMDVFAACYAPGVSAPAANGIAPGEVFKSVFDLIINSKKLISLDFAEINPDFDVDLRTAKLAASLIFRAIQ